MRTMQSAGCLRCGHARAWVLPDVRVDLWINSAEGSTKKDLRCQVVVCEQCGHMEWRADIHALAHDAENLRATLQ